MRRILYIDGSNLYGVMTEILEPGRYLDFSSVLSIIHKDFAYDEVRFYGTYMRVDEEQSEVRRLMSNTQIEFFNNVRQCDKVIFIEGHFSRATGKEKGVDVKLAVDISVGAAIHWFDEAMIMTGDADLLYAVQTVKRFNRQVYMAAFASRFPFGMVYYVDRRYVYDYNGYFLNKVVPSMKKRPRNIIIRELMPNVGIHMVCS